MKTTLKDLKKQWQEVTKMPLFEIEVKRKDTGETDYIIFDISLQKNTFVAQHEALTEKQERSKKIAYVKQVLDPFYSLDENLTELYNECITALIDSEFFELV
tara:strand:- start:93 stop:398 length:306 start_codon:yes stop_codon:yes gene_type:complete